jgi:DnaJ family protein C protein 17
MLMDPSKRSYVNNKLEEDRRKKEKYAVMEKKKRGLVDVSLRFHDSAKNSPADAGLQALLAREEETKRAKANASQRFAQETEEEAIKQAGRKMREAMQKASAPQTTATPSTNISRPPPTGTRPSMTPVDLTLTLQFPADSDPATTSLLSSSTTLEPRITSLYGPVNFVILKEPATDAPEKKKKRRGARAIVEFKESNWSGCWACWKDHVVDSGTGRARRPLVQGTKVKWATKDGATPEWVNWAEQQHATNGSTPLTAPADPVYSNTTRPSAKVSSSFAASFASSFPTPEERRQQEIQRAKVQAERAAAEDYEGATLFKMRQIEKEKLEAEIRRQEEDEA